MNDKYEVKLVKLNNGEEFIAHIEYSDKECTTIVNPSMMIEDPDHPGQMGFSPWCPMAIERSMVLMSNQILFFANVHEQVVDAHKRSFGPKDPLILVPN